MHSPLVTQQTHFSFLYTSPKRMNLSHSHVTPAQEDLLSSTLKLRHHRQRQQKTHKNYDKCNNNTEKIQSIGKWKEFTFKLCI